MSGLELIVTFTLVGAIVGWLIKCVQGGNQFNGAVGGAMMGSGVVMVAISITSLITIIKIIVTLN